MEIIQRIGEFHDELTEWRRDIHAHPELGFEEQRTSDLVAQRLAELGCEVFRGIGKTGVVGRLRAGNSSRSIGLRADMDCLPIQEATNLPYRSRHEGRMHACGHDGHTTMLLGAARYLAETRNFDGTVHLIFQPAEEGLGGGKAMVEDGLFDRFPCDAIFRHAQPAGAGGRQVPDPHRTDDGGRRLFRHRRDRARRAWRAPRSRDRSGRGRQPHHYRLADDRVAQRQTARHRRRQRDADPWRRRLQRDPRDGGDPRHHARLPARDDGADRAQHAATRLGDRRGIWRLGGAQLSGDLSAAGQRSSRSRLHRRDGGGAGRRRTMSTARATW